MKRMLLLLVTILITEIIIAIICGPYSCEWGNEVYFYSGVTLSAIMCVLPFLERTFTTKKRIAYSLLFIIISILTWCACFMLCGFKILCRLF